MLRPRTALVLLVATASACAAEQPPIVTTPPVAPAPPPPPLRARWIFTRPDRGISARLDLGGGSTLYVGRSGRRQLSRGTDPLVDAPTLALKDLLGVLKGDKGQFVFVGADGDVLIGQEPLGPLEPPRPGPLGNDVKPGTHLSWVTTGKAAIIGITPDGHVVRSADYGASWQQVVYPGSAKSHGRPASVELDANGNGLLLHFPQRVFVTRDDGATWTHVPSPGIGARQILRDGADHLYLEGRSSSSRARLEGGGLKVSSEPPVPLFTPPPSPTAVAAPADKNPSRRTAVRTIFSGDRVVELAEIHRHGKVREIEVSSGPLGGKAGDGVAHSSLVGVSGASRHVAGFGAELVYLREDDDVEASAPTTTVFRSQDYGATWAQDATLKGAEVQERSALDLAVGPDGWTFVTALCPRYSPEGRSCAHRQIRPSGSSTFQDMQFTEELTPHAFAFDRERDRVYALGVHNGYKYVYESPLTQNRFTRTKMLDVSASTAAGLTVDAQGTVRVLAYDDSKHAWALHRRRAGGEELPLLYVPIDKGTVAFAGARGLVFAGHERGWETADGGETWIRTAANSTDGLTCTEAGCLNGGAERVGWDLPAVQDEEKVVASNDPPKTGSTPKVAVEARTLPRIDLACKPTGSPTPLASVPGSELLDSRSADVRWASLKTEADGKTSIVVASRTAIKDTQLLPAAPKPPPALPPGTAPRPSVSVASGTRVLNDGVVAARYVMRRDAQHNRLPIDVELTWWSASTGKTKHHTLTKLEPFYVSTWGSFSGTPQIVDGGLLFQPSSGREVYFIHDDGKVETFSIPNSAGVRNAERIGKRWLLADSYSGSVQLSWSDDGAKQWSQREWGLDRYSGSALMALIDGKPTVSFSRGSLPSELYAVDANVANDPPIPVVLDSATIDTPCDARAASLRVTSYIPSDERRVHARVDPGKDPALIGQLSTSTRVTHSTQSGTICTSAYVLSGYDGKSYDTQTAFLYPDAKGWSGWWFRRVPDPKDGSKKIVQASALACEVHAGTGAAR